LSCPAGSLEGPALERLSVCGGGPRSASRARARRPSNRLVVCAYWATRRSRARPSVDAVCASLGLPEKLSRAGVPDRGGAPARQWRGIRDRDTVEPCAGSPLPYVHRDGVPCLQLALICEGVQGLEVCGLVVVVAVLSKPRAACTSPEAALRSSAARVLASAVRVSLFCSRAVAAVLLARSRQAFSSGVAPRSLAPRGGRQPRAVRR